jgi:predicted nuclease of predicted toxin-antitoxin system
VRFLADENVEEPIVEALLAAGHDVVRVGEVGAGIPDRQVLELANRESRLLLTNDKDFGEFYYREGMISSGVVLLRLRTEDGARKAASLLAVISRAGDHLLGHFAVIAEAGVRFRPLRHVRGTE